MTAQELVNPLTSPGEWQFFGTDQYGFKDWQGADSLVRSVAPQEKEFPIPAQTWTWIHGLGYRPHVQVTNEYREIMLSYVVHDDLNTIRVEHSYNQAGWLTIR